VRIAREPALVGLVFLARDGEEEKLRVRLDGHEPPHDRTVPAGEGRGPAVGQCVRYGAEDRGGIVQIVDAEREQIGLAGQIGAPEILRIGIGLPVLPGGHAAAGEDPGGAVRQAGQILPPRIGEKVVIGGLAGLAGSLQLAGGHAVADDTDGAEDGAESAVVRNPVQRPLIRIVREKV